MIAFHIYGMDNNTPSVLNRKCQIFNRLYHTQSCGTGSCLNTRVSDDYMCPKVGQPKPGTLTAPCNCFAKQALIGKYHVCDRENEGQGPPRSGVAVDDAKKFLPERLNSVTKDSVLDRVKSLKTNPDFAFALGQIRKGSKGLQEFVTQNAEMIGGGANGEYSDIVSQIKSTVKDLGKVSEDVLNKVSQVTVGQAMEEFVDYYATGQPPSIYTPKVGQKLRRINRDGREYCALVANTLGELTVGDVLNMGYHLAGHHEFNKLSSKVVQTGGMMYKLFTLPIYDEAVYADTVMQLFDQLKSTINYITLIFKRRMARNGLPRELLENVEQIQRGLTLCLQMLQYEILVDKKKKIPELSGDDASDRRPMRATCLMSGGGINYGSGNPYYAHPRIYQPNDTTDVPCRLNTNVNVNCDCRKCTSPFEVVVDNHDANQITPTWYFDMTQNPVGKHAPRSRRIWDSQIPNILKESKQQLTNRCINCTQPNWHPNCL